MMQEIRVKRLCVVKGDPFLGTKDKFYFDVESALDAGVPRGTWEYVDVLYVREATRARFFALGEQITEVTH